MVFIYDANGVPLGLKYRNSTYAQSVWDSYWYERNLQGDIVAIYNDSNVKLASYTYDAWGNHGVTYHNGGNSILAIISNPIRYRGYYYDTDLGLYYLQTRYYDSNIGRFINADSALYCNMLGYNMYVYCYNSPVIHIDPYGTDAILIIAFGNKGFPVVGHSALMIQTGDSWYLVEYTGTNKENAKVFVSDPINSNPYEHIENVFESDYWTLELEGDYSQSYEYAKPLNETNLGGYNLLTNNCSHFVADVLKHGESSSPSVEFLHEETRTTTPVISYFYYYATTQIIPPLKEKLTRFKEWIRGD